MIPKSPAALARAADLPPGEVKTAAEAIDLARAANEALKPADAIVLLRRALELDPSNAVAARELASTLLDSGHADAARALLEEFLEAHPDRAEARLFYAQLLLRAGELDLVTVQCRRCVEALPAWTAPYPIWIRALCRLGDVRGAEKVLDAFRPIADDPRAVALAESMINKAR